MSWSFRVKQRDKIAIALGAIFLVIVLANWFVNYNVSQISGQFRSVYEDRLVPALDISAITELNYKNHMLLEEHILSNDQPTKEILQLQIARNQQEIDSIVIKFEATYLTKQEGQDLRDYKKAQIQLIAIQKTILDLSVRNNAVTAKNTYNTLGKEKFQELLGPLHALSQLQETVGHELYASADRSINAIRILSYLVIGMAVIISLLVSTLLQTSRKLTAIKQQNFHLN